MNLLVFRLSGQRCALAIDRVREIVQAVAIARLPDVPPIVEGVVDFRGTLVPVLDVRSRFGLEPLPLAPDQQLLLASAGARAVALRIDRAEEIVAVDDDAIEAAGAVVAGTAHVAGLVRLEDGLVVIHDLERFLDLDEGRRLDSARTAREGGT